MSNCYSEVRVENMSLNVTGWGTTTITVFSAFRRSVGLKLIRVLHLSPNENRGSLCEYLMKHMKLLATLKQYLVKTIKMKPTITVKVENFHSEFWSKYCTNFIHLILPPSNYTWEEKLMGKIKQNSQIFEFMLPKVEFGVFYYYLNWEMCAKKINFLPRYCNALRRS